MKLLHSSKLIYETSAMVKTPRWYYCNFQKSQRKLLKLSKLPDQTTALVKLPDKTTAIIKTVRWNYCNCQNSQMKPVQPSKLPDRTNAILKKNSQMKLLQSSKLHYENNQIVKNPRWNYGNLPNANFSRHLALPALQKLLSLIKWFTDWVLLFLCLYDQVDKVE